MPWSSGSAAVSRAARTTAPRRSVERLRVYHGETKPLVAHYDERGLLRRVDGAQDADAVEADVRAAIKGS